MDGPVASAVVLPEELRAPASPSHKRRNSSITEDNVKRPRIDDEQEATGRRDPIPATKAAVPVKRERGRERRLFGAVLGALSQNTSTAGQKRRAEIEKRQQARRQSENEESEQRKLERIARRKEQRQREQKHVEVQVMRARHENLRNMAHFFQTETEPRLYYKPWETSPEEETIIQNQIAEVEDTITREIEEYEARRQAELRQEASELVGHNAAGSHSGKDRTIEASQGTHATNGGTKGRAHSPGDLEMEDDHAENPSIVAVSEERTAEPVHDGTPGHEAINDDLSKDNDDDNGEDIVEEAAEDTVIY
ncbi:hypothetical protein ACN47E_007554 [Coniothyrium glycines]